MVGGVVTAGTVVIVVAQAGILPFFPLNGCTAACVRVRSGRVAWSAVVAVRPALEMSVARASASVTAVIVTVPLSVKAVRPLSAFKCACVRDRSVLVALIAVVAVRVTLEMSVARAFASVTAVIVTVPLSVKVPTTPLSAFKSACVRDRSVLVALVAVTAVRPALEMSVTRAFASVTAAIVTMPVPA